MSKLSNQDQASQITEPELGLNFFARLSADHFQGKSWLVYKDGDLKKKKKTHLKNKNTRATTPIIFFSIPSKDKRIELL